MMNEALSTIMTKNVSSVFLHESLDVARNRLLYDKIHHLPVINKKGELRGILTSYDILQLGLASEKFRDILVCKVMNPMVIKVEPTDKIGTAAELLLDKRFHALPVVQNKKLVGIVTSSDIMKYEFRKEYPKPILYKDIYAKQNTSILSGRAS